MLPSDSYPLTSFKAGQPIMKPALMRVTYIYERQSGQIFNIFRDQHIDDRADRGSSMSTVNPNTKFTVYGTPLRISSTVGLTWTFRDEQALLLKRMTLPRLSLRKKGLC